MSRLRVLLADDHKIVVEGLRGLLEPEMELVGTVEDGRALLSAVKHLNPDIVVVDISMPLLNGIDATEQIKKVNKKIKIIFLTMHPDVTYATRAFQVGASGYVLKHSAPSELITAIHEAQKGRTYVTPLIAKEVLNSFMEGTHKKGKNASQLTARQREVLQLLVEGHTAKAIASLLNISPRTVEFHKNQIMEDLKLHNKAELIQYAIRHGLTSL
ncbi:MAG TPA: response regulator transcription factor [Nitrospiria bacterium]|jgi:DNA-binding NarL/FixJ family response regulator